MKRILPPIVTVLVLLAATLSAASGRCVPAPHEHGDEATHEATGDHSHADEQSVEHADPTSSPEPDPCACHCSEFPLATPTAMISFMTPSASSGSPIEMTATPAAEPPATRPQMAFFTTSAGPPPGRTLRGQPTRAPPLPS